MNKRIVSILISVLFIVSGLTICVSAEEATFPPEPDDVIITIPGETSTETEVSTDAVPETETESTPEFSDPKAEELWNKLVAYSEKTGEPVIEYTSDSVRQAGIYLDPLVDNVLYRCGMEIQLDLDFGIEIYDDPETDIIDGIRINGLPVKSLKYWFDLDNPPDGLVVEVRLVYAEGFTGTIARIIDGDFDLSTLLENPLITLQIIYYMVTLITFLFGAVAALFSKHKKVKTSNEIAAQVDTRAKEAFEAFTVSYTEYLKGELTPIMTAIADTNKAVVKALTLSTSKSKEAPIALLDVLQDVSGVDIAKVIDDARKSVTDNLLKADKNKERIENALTQIAEGTYQEVSNVKQESESTEETVVKKSIF